MGRRLDSFERRQRRFLLPLFQFTAPAVVFMIALPMIEDAICQFMRSQAPSAACMPIVPSFVWYLISAAVIGGLCLSAWRFYRDHIRGDAYHDDFENY